MPNYTFLFEVSPIKPDGTMKTFQLCSTGSSKRTVYLDNKEWTPLIETPPDFDFKLVSSGKLTFADVSYGVIEFICSDVYGNEEWSSFDWTNVQGRCWYGIDGAPFSEFQRVFEGKVSGFTRSDIYGKVELLGAEADIQVPALYEKYLGLPGREGGPGLKGNLKPRAHGFCINVELPVIDTVNWVYQVHGYGRINAIPNVYEFGQALAPSSGDVATYEALVAMDLAPAQWATCLAEGMVRLGGQTDKKLTCDIEGSAPGGVYAKTAGAIIRQLIKEVNPAAQFGTFPSCFDNEWCYFGKEETNVWNIVYQAANDVGGYIYPDGLGVWQAGDFYAPVNKGELRSDRSSDLQVISHEELQSSGPISLVSVGHTKVWSPHTIEQLSPAVYTDAAAEAAAALSAAEQARLAAEAAAAQALVAIERITAMASDNKLSRAEKKQVIKELQSILAERPGIVAQATMLGIVIERNDYTGKVDALLAYLEGLDPAYTDLEQDTDIDGPLLRQKFVDVYTTRQILLNKIVDAARNWSNIQGDGKPEDYATVGAPPGTPVGDRPSEQVISEIDKAKQDIADAKQAIIDIDTLANGVKDQIDALIENLGPTGDAAAAADAAEQFKDLAEAAAANAELAKQGAEGAFASSSTKAGEAKTYRDEASTFRNDAQGYASTASSQASLVAAAKKGAEDAATAANTSAGIATAKASESDQSAKAAQAAQVTASTASKDAKDAATAASSSYTNAESARKQAGDYAQAASGSANTANTRAGEAAASARAASGSAAVATDKASEAASSASLAATYTSGAGNIVVSDFAGGTAGWNLTASNPSLFSWGINNADFTIPGERFQGLLCLQRSSSLSGSMYSDWAAVTQGEWIQASAWLASRECTAHLVIEWGDGGSNYLYASPASEATGSYSHIGWVNLDQWKRVWVKAQVPSNARFARIRVVKGPWQSNPRNDLSWAFMLRPMLAPASAGQTSPSPYSPRGAGPALARVEETASAAASAAQAAASSVRTLETNVNGYGSRINTVEQSVTQVRNTANEAFDRVTGARWSKEAIAGNGRAQLTVYAYDNNGRIFSGVDIMGNVTIDGNLTVNGTITSTKLQRNAATQVWYTSSSNPVQPISAPSTWTTMLSMNFTKYMGSESVIQFDVQCPMYGSDAVKVEVYLDIWAGGASPLQNRGFRMEVDGNNETYLPFIYQHLFQNIPAGNYEARMVMRRTSGHDCRTNGLYHMIVREFKR